jgi:hypothetical protein
MSYLWQPPHRLPGTRLKGAIGTLAGTPIDQALDSTRAELMPSPTQSSAAAAVVA